MENQDLSYPISILEEKKYEHLGRAARAKGDIGYPQSEVESELFKANKCQAAIECLAKHSTL